MLIREIIGNPLNVINKCIVKKALLANRIKSKRLNSDSKRILSKTLRG